ncbi:MAG: SRPBCC family protein [Gordonia amarae]
MSTSQIVWLVIGVLAALGVVGIVGLVVLWGTASNPGRSAVRKEIPAGEVDRYIERGAAFAIVLTERTPLARREVWDRVVNVEYMSSLPLLSGPAWSGDDVIPGASPVIPVGAARTMSGTLMSVSERVTHVEDEAELTLTGTAVSFPLAIHSFAERWTITDGPRGTLVVTWAIAGSPRWVGWLPWRWAVPFVRPILGFVLRHILRLKPFRSVR